jgi:hypothetical protein
MPAHEAAWWNELACNVRSGAPSDKGFSAAGPWHRAGPPSVRRRADHTEIQGETVPTTPNQPENHARSTHRTLKPYGNTLEEPLNR